ncbi:MAG TPA: hypothetical protein VIA06_03485 [Candidatus Dormibacteraeota bacterium]|jgi:uncharacterized membrane protein|nr:hypothetical protein [Candidatus Dormibacteraeota bacterium]
MNIVVAAAAFVAAGVEWVEALTIVLAAGITRGWRSALTGVGFAVIAVALLIVGLGAAVESSVALTAVRTAIGVLLLLFGLKWLRKAILRSSGHLGLHDEDAIYRRTTERLGVRGETGSLDWSGVATAGMGVFLEGLEVVVIVVALGGLNSIGAAAAGAIASLIVVAGIGAALRAPLSRVPENALKYVVGIMLTSFGTFFAGEGLGLRWWHADLSILVLIACYLVVSVAFVALLRVRKTGGWTLPLAGPRHRVAEVWEEIWGLFVEDGALALGALVLLLGAALLLAHVAGASLLAAGILVIGILVFLGAALLRASAAH